MDPSVLVAAISAAIGAAGLVLGVNERRRATLRTEVEAQATERDRLIAATYQTKDDFDDHCTRISDQLGALAERVARVEAKTEQDGDES